MKTNKTNPIKKIGALSIGLFLFASNVYADRSNGVGPNQRPTVVGKIRRDLTYAGKYPVTLKGTAFFIDDASYNSSNFHPCGDNIKAITTQDVTLYAKVGDEIEIFLQRNLEEFDETTDIYLHPKVKFRDIKSNLALLEFTQADQDLFYLFPREIRPLCVGLNGNESSLNNTSILYAYSFNSSTPLSYFAKSTGIQNGNIPSVRKTYGFKVEDAIGTKSNMTGFNGGIVADERGQTPLGMVLKSNKVGTGSSSDVSLNVISLRTVLNLIRSNTLSTPVHNTGYTSVYNSNYNSKPTNGVIYHPESEEIEYDRVFFTEMSKRFAVYFHLERGPSKDDPFDKSLVSITKLSPSSSFYSSLFPINSALPKDQKYKVVLHAIKNQKIYDLYDLINALEANNSGYSTSLRNENPNGEMSITLRDIDGSTEPMLVGSVEKNDLNKAKGSMDYVIGQYKEWLDAYLFKNQRIIVPTPNGGNSNYKYVVFVSIDEFKFDGTPVKQLNGLLGQGMKLTDPNTIMFSPEESIYGIKETLNKYFDLMLQIESAPSTKEEFALRAKMLTLLNTAIFSGDLIQNFGSRSDLIDLSRTSGEMTLSKMIQMIKSIKYACQKRMSDIEKQSEALKRR